MYKVLIVEDDSLLAGILKEKLEAWGMEAVIAEDFYHIVELFSSENPHLVLMDISLPCFDGYHWTKKIRALSSVPILFISSRGDDLSSIMAMQLGADDLIEKPFSLDVLLAKIQALLRRAYDYQSSSSLIEHNGLILNLEDQSIHYQDQQISLSRNEFRILSLLLHNKGKVISREKIMDGLWKTDLFVDENTLSVNVNRLRKKLREIGAPDLIETRIREGYVIR